jgi:anti-sigma B factor antagonist
MSTTTTSATQAMAQFLPVQERKSQLKLSTEIEVHEDVTVVHCHGRIAYRDEAESLSRTLAQLLPRAQQIVLDLRDVEMIDSAGLGSLLTALHLAQASGSNLRLASPNRRTLSLFQLTNLDTVFEIYPALQDALLVSHWQMA